jgi:hypothetical protein
MTISLRERVKLEKYATKYLCGSRRVRRRPGTYADFERFLRSKAMYILLYTEFGFCPFCKKPFKGYLGLRNHLKGYHECGKTFRELVNQLVEEYLSRKYTKSS